MFSKILKNEQGSTLVVIIIIFSFLVSIALGVTFLTLQNKISVTGTLNKNQALDLAEAGVEKALWELQKGNSGYTGEIGNTSLPGGQFDVAVTVVDSNNKYITATGYVPNRTFYKQKRSVRVKVSDEPSETDVSFNYGVQVGDFGVDMTSNNTKITGNVYSNGPIIGGGPSKSQITGDAIVSGAGGIVRDVLVGMDARSHVIQGCTVQRDAYYWSSFSNAPAGRNAYPNSTDPERKDFPVMDSSILQWEEEAEAGGVINGNHDIANSGTIGPVKINGNLTIGSNITVTVRGTIWVTGNITSGSGVILQLDPGYGSSGGLIIADNPSDRTASGVIDVGNNVMVNGSGQPKSYIMMISTKISNTSANPAIFTSPNASSAVYFAPNGWAYLKNNGQIKSVVGKGLYIAPNANIIYDSGLADTTFSGGPGGTWAVREWQEVASP